MINLDIGGGVERCLEIVDNEADIIVDVLMCNNAKFRPLAHSLKTLGAFARSRMINSYHKTLIDLDNARQN